MVAKCITNFCAILSLLRAKLFLQLADVYQAVLAISLQKLLCIKDVADIQLRHTDVFIFVVLRQEHQAVLAMRLPVFLHFVMSM